MMYSSSKSILLKEIPIDLNDIFQIFSTQSSELTSNGLDEFAQSLDAPNPLTEKEKEKQMFKYEEVCFMFEYSDYDSHLILI